MNLENAGLVAQLIDSMQTAVKNLEKENNVEKINKTKEEILKFQKRIAELL
jgi:hypothetical protein